MFLFVLMLNAPVNNVSVMSGQSHRFLGITTTFRGVNVSLLKDTTRQRYRTPGPLAPESETLPLGHRAHLGEHVIRKIWHHPHKLF